MIPTLRQRFNQAFSAARYEQVVQRLNEACETNIAFRVCETPVFLPPELLRQMVTAAQEIVAQLHTPEYLAASAAALPAAFSAPNEGAHPDFIQVDFAITENQNGELAPKLIELQGCASLYGFQLTLAHVFQEFYDLAGLPYLLGDLSDQAYVALLRDVIVGNHDPAAVVLLEIDPQTQKTLPDFNVTSQLLGIPIVNIRAVETQGDQLFYRHNGQPRVIRRIYNRVIIDELVNKGITPSFDFRRAWDVEWAGHPNWYFRWSKFSLPYLKHQTVPRAWRLDALNELPTDLDSFVLKPLFSFAGSGVKVNVTPEDLAAIPAAARGEYLLQEKVNYAPVISTTENTASKVEVRIMLLWPQDAPAPLAVNTLTRLSQGAMMGVDFNKNKTWVGSSCGFTTPQ